MSVQGQEPEMGHMCHVFASPTQAHNLRLSDSIIILFGIVWGLHWTGVYPALFSKQATMLSLDRN